jgi:hypothetical protein
MVVTATGFGKTMSVLVNMSGNDFIEETEKFFNDLDLDKTTISPNRPGTGSTKIYTTMTTLKDYDFVAPEGWQMQNQKDHILIQNMQSGCSVRIIPSQPSSGDLEKDAKAVFDLMYAGWNYPLAGEQKYVQAKGFTMQGLPYSMIEAPMSITDAANRYQIEEGGAVVVKTGSQITIISVRHNSGLMAHDGCRNNYNTWPRFFNSFTVKNISSLPVNEDVSKRIVGVWTNSGAGVAADYTFAANGHYQSLSGVGATTVTTDYYSKYITTKSSAFQGDGTYSINGNQLTMLGRGDNSPEQIKVRFEKVNKGGTGWTDRIYLLRRNVTDGKEYEVYYDNRKF